MTCACSTLSDDMLKFENDQLNSVFQFFNMKMSSDDLANVGNRFAMCEISCIWVLNSIRSWEYGISYFELKTCTCDMKEWSYVFEMGRNRFAVQEIPYISILNSIESREHWFWIIEYIYMFLNRRHVHVTRRSTRTTLEGWQSIHRPQNTLYINCEVNPIMRTLILKIWTKYMDMWQEGFLVRLREGSQ